GRPAAFSIGFGAAMVRSFIRVPRPAANMTALGMIDPGADTRVCGVETRLDALRRLNERYLARRSQMLRSARHRDESRCSSLKAAPRSNLLSYRTCSIGGCRLLLD